MQQIVPVLQRDHARLQRPQEQHRAGEDQRCQHDEVHPDRRFEFDLHPGGEADGDRAEKENQEHRGTIARVLGREIEPADGARGTYGQETGQDFAFAAARAAASQRRLPDGDRGIRRRHYSPSGRAAPMPHQ